jgi:hypothetical protein
VAAGVSDSESEKHIATGHIWHVIHAEWSNKSCKLPSDVDELSERLADLDLHSPTLDSSKMNK